VAQERVEPTANVQKFVNLDAQGTGTQAITGGRPGHQQHGIASNIRQLTQRAWYAGFATENGYLSASATATVLGIDRHG